MGGKIPPTYNHKIELYKRGYFSYQSIGGFLPFLGSGYIMTILSPKLNPLKRGAFFTYGEGFSACWEGSLPTGRVLCLLGGFSAYWGGLSAYWEGSLPTGECIYPT